MSRRTSSRIAKRPARAELPQQSDSTIRRNLVGLGSLPTELLTEITSYLPENKVPYRTYIDKPFKKNERGLERINFLRALSQTCRSLRSFCLPLLWERIEVCASKHPKLQSAWEKELATELVRQLEIVTVRDPSLAQYVRIVNVLVTQYSHKAVIQELARSMDLFPNLNIIQILGDPALGSPYDSAFKGKIFSKVHSLQLPWDASALLGCCPNVKRVFFHPSPVLEFPDFLTKLESFKYHPPLEEIWGFDHDQAPFADLIINFPQTTVVNLFQHYHTYWPKLNIEPFLTLEALECFRIECLNPVSRHHIKYAEWHKREKDIAIAILSKLTTPVERKHRCVIFLCATSDAMEHHVVSGICNDEKDCAHFLERPLQAKLLALSQL